MGFGKIRIDPADKAFSQWVRLRDKMCLRCRKPLETNVKGLPTSLQASHFQGRGKESTRFDPDNVIALCMGCHGYFTSNPGEHYQWQVRRLGVEKVEEIVLRSNLTTKKDRKAEFLYWKDKLKEDFNI
jgi:hypothetical protein